MTAGALDDVRAVADSAAGGVLGKPASDLGVATRYVGYWEQCGQPVSRREVPAPGVTLVLSLGPLMRVTTPVIEEPVEVGSFVAGLHRGPALTEHDGLQGGVQVDLTPFGARAVFGLPLDEMTDRVVGLDELLGSDADRILGALVDAPTWSDRFRVLDRAFTRSARLGPRPAAETRWLYAQLARAADHAPLAELAAETGRSHRHLVAQFKRDVGLAPKAFARLVRFRRAIELLSRPGTLGSVAAEAGYYDQAHFNREFRSMAGTSPGRYRTEQLASEVNFVQDPETGDP